MSLDSAVIADPARLIFPYPDSTSPPHIRNCSDSVEGVDYWATTIAPNSLYKSADNFMEPDGSAYDIYRRNIQLLERNF